MKTNIHFWSYLAHLFLEREMFQTNLVEKIKTRISCSVSPEIMAHAHFDAGYLRLQTHA